MTIARPMFPPVDSSRRGFLSQAAGLAAGGTALALATVTPTPAAALPADPVYAAIEAHEKAYAAVRAACAESDRLCELADKIAGKYILDIPDLRTPSEKDTRFYILPVAYQQNGIDFFEAPTKRYVDVYLPGDENAQLRKGFYRKLDEIEKARTAVYGDIDAVVTAPSGDEAGAVDDMIDTVPTTIGGLLAFMTYLAKARGRDEDMLYAEHLEPLVDTLGKAAAILSRH